MVLAREARKGDVGRRKTMAERALLRAGVEFVEGKLQGAGGGGDEE